MLVPCCSKYIGFGGDVGANDCPPNSVQIKKRNQRRYRIINSLSPYTMGQGSYGSLASLKYLVAPSSALSLSIKPPGLHRRSGANV